MGRKNQHYMRPDERQQLEALLKAKVPVTKIAKQLGFCRKTIYNEIKRGTYMHTIDYYDKAEYSAQKGQIIHNENQSRKGRPLKIGNDIAYANYLEYKMLGIQEDGTIDKRKRYSPAAALASAKKAGFQTEISIPTLYRYIDQGMFLRLTNKDLWEKPKRKKRTHKAVQRIAHPKLPSIINRPCYINDRSEPGHWEMDLVVSAAGKAAALLVLTERMSRKEIIKKLPDKQAKTVRRALKNLKKTNQFGSITTDNGSEFLEYDELKQILPNTDIYYCHSFASWEKGSCENQNRMIRRWFPKGTDFGKVRHREIIELQDWMNNYPRRSLGWLSANEVMEMVGPRCG